MGYVVGALLAVALVMAWALWSAVGQLSGLTERVANLGQEQERHCRILIAHQQDGARIEALGRNGDGVLIAPEQVAKEVAYQLITLRGRLEALEAQLLRIQEEQARSLKWQGEPSVPAIGRPA